MPLIELGTRAATTMIFAWAGWYLAKLIARPAERRTLLIGAIVAVAFSGLLGDVHLIGIGDFIIALDNILAGLVLGVTLGWLLQPEARLHWDE